VCYEFAAQENILLDTEYLLGKKYITLKQNSKPIYYSKREKDRAVKSAGRGGQRVRWEADHKKYG
jgi:hypothetical protein